MARVTTNPAVWVKKLEKVLAKAAPIRPGETLSAKPMARLLGIGWDTLRGWCETVPGFSESGAFEEGGNGIEWAFNPLATVLYLSAHFAAERDKLAADTRRVREIAGGKDLEAVPEDFDLERIGKLIRVSADLQAAKMRAGQLVDANVAASAISTMMSTLQQTVLMAAQEQDPTGSWSPEMRESFEDGTRSILLRMEQAGQACLRTLNGGSAQPG